MSLAATSAALSHDLAARYREIRERSRAIFDIVTPDAYYDRPISLRNPIVFYEGHLPGFSVNTLLKLALKRPGIREDYEILFARGIDPESESAAKAPTDVWPSRREVEKYATEADRRILDVLSGGPSRLTTLAHQAAHTILEHELMHQETLLYMLHQLPYDKKRRRAAPNAAGRTVRSLVGRAENVSIPIPAGVATLGAEPDDLDFGWDNEFPSLRVDVEAFEVDRFPVSNADYLAFLEATGAQAPHFWEKSEGQWFWRGMFAPVPLPLEAPAYVTYEEATRYAEWKEKRLLTEAEWHRAAFGTPEGTERPFPWGNVPPRSEHGQFDFQSWDPVPIGLHPAGASAWGVQELVGNGWEWTSTPFAGFPGFAPMVTYPEYSADFFDDAHFVLKGASPVTARELIRRSFRNWFRPNYPYMYAKFRCAR